MDDILLPLGRWLPPWLFGPLLTAFGVALMAIGHPQTTGAWLCAIAIALYGASGTLYWLIRKRNAFDDLEAADTDA